MEYTYIHNIPYYNTYIHKLNPILKHTYTTNIYYIHILRPILHTYGNITH